MYPVSQSKSWLQSSVGIVHFSSGGDKFRVDVSGVPVKELVAVVGGHRPLLLRGGDAKLAVQGQGVWHVDLRGVLQLSVNVLDEAVGDAVPGESLVAWFPKHWVETKVSCRVDHWHGSLVPVDVVPLAE